ncbi:MAG: 2-amino-4-hydroxy-6-hydroxymethyldihydropteridine diphosphokinase [Treponema sp.]|uniref:2-amino-4-hydroxy-6- hydroxymethyldihydropteridine diphosphokinase n=1 Tax=Treponema sp. TaxID=166 RepID=UPI001B6BCB18|nr:2-amino-4-hydroxy-6-hydroxymethyldihydropteridine diphosphokinase [Treponema sp.]MBP5587995.1 2-amino-4-hydroxy-6-hydroxymethyldihydropteridine diphosphokinase [Treponema sp.]MCR5385975.1 2-amino-4-hydroxy-6-hydroxymethyldihydropteridine diphosphokinase [Treponema sp.]
MCCVVLGLGSNRSYNGIDSISLLRMAVTELQKIMDNLVVSSVYRTKPMYVENQDDFYNMVIAGNIHEGYNPQKLLQYIHEVEGFLGRDRSRELRFGPRAIDIDIEFFGDLEVNLPDLEIPHPRIAERAFVLQPLLEILPKCADVMKGEKLKKFEHVKIDTNDVAFYMDSAEFLLLKVNNEVQDGNTDTRSS